MSKSTTGLTLPKPHFFRLPREVRDEIYKHVVAGIEAYEYPDHGSYLRIKAPFDKDDLTRHFLCPGIFRVNSQMRFEARIACLSTNCFHVVSLCALQWLLETIGASGRAHLRSLFLHRPVFYWRCPHHRTPDVFLGTKHWPQTKIMPGDVPQVLSLLADCRRLKFLQVEFTCGELDEQPETELQNMELRPIPTSPTPWQYSDPFAPRWPYYRHPDRRCCHTPCEISDGMAFRLAHLRQLRDLTSVGVTMSCVCIESVYSSSRHMEAKNLKNWLEKEMLRPRDNGSEILNHLDQINRSTEHITIHEVKTRCS